MLFFPVKSSLLRVPESVKFSFSRLSTEEPKIRGSKTNTLDLPSLTKIYFSFKTSLTSNSSSCLTIGIDNKKTDGLDRKKLIPFDFAPIEL
jgi:hypothetical protein